MCNPVSITSFSSLSPDETRDVNDDANGDEHFCDHNNNNGNVSQGQLNIIQTENELKNSLYLHNDSEEESSISINSTLIDGDPDLYCNSRERRKVNTNDFNLKEKMSISSLLVALT